ncbi:MAG TPA: hypothetical protein DDZ83_07440 [Nitrospinae bacterium]|nr:hypothetical protein [Nitrospinota bacterium]
MKRPDLSDRLLAYLIFAAAIVIVTWFALLPDRAPAWKLPGSPRLYVIAVVGSLLLLVSVLFVFAKRTGRWGSPVGWFTAHVAAAAAGSVLVAIHSAGFLRYVPALLLVALLGLAALGVWARILLSRRISATFAEKHESFAPVSGADRERLGAIIREKEGLLEKLSPGAREGTFSPALGHWLARPGLTRAYARLVREESGLLGTRGMVPAAQAYWRRLHMGLAALFVLGLIGHIVTVTFFAGYVSGGGVIYWWHLAAW